VVMTNEGTFRTQDGRTWSSSPHSNVPAGQYFYAADRRQVFASDGRQMWQSDDDGGTWRRAFFGTD
jgi:hypothetical protein